MLATQWRKIDTRYTGFKVCQMRSSSAGSGVASRMGAWIGAPFRTAPAMDWNALLGRAADLRDAWRDLSVVRVYLVVAGTALAIFTGLTALWVSGQLERGLVSGQTPSTIALVEDVVQPLIQGLNNKKTLSAEAATAFDNLMAASDVAAQVAVLRLWRANGTLVYRSDRPGDSAPAWRPSGSSDPELDQAILEERLGTKLVEIKAPLYRTGTRDIIAIAQLYRRADSIGATLQQMVIQSVLVLAALGAAMLAVIFWIVQKAGRQIDTQQHLIGEQKAEQAHYSSQNEALRKLTEVIHRRGVDHSENMLRRIGSDLHDGPAQHLALVLLRLDELVPLLDKPAESGQRTSGNTLETIRRATSDALKEIRHISSGLALPELQKICLQDALLIAVRAHQRATGTPVAATFDNLPTRLPLPMTICLYRFSQEALNNAFRHAGGTGQSVHAKYEEGTISVEVADTGPGFVVDPAATSRERLGLSGLRYRVESLGGSLQINSAMGRGAKLTVQFRNPLA